MGLVAVMCRMVNMIRLAGYYNDKSLFTFDLKQMDRIYLFEDSGVKKKTKIKKIYRKACSATLNTLRGVPRSLNYIWILLKILLLAGRIKGAKENILRFIAPPQPLHLATFTYHLIIHPNPPPPPVFSHSARVVETGSRVYVSVSYDAAKSSRQAFPGIHQSMLNRIAVFRQGVSS